MKRSYYSGTYHEFMTTEPEDILKELVASNTFSTLYGEQRMAWIEQIKILKEKFANISFDRILFEYVIPRLGKRVDNVLFYQGVVYVLEFKVGADTYDESDLKQTEQYALDLKDFQEGSKDRKIVPILVATDAPDYNNKIVQDREVLKPLRANGKNLGDVMTLAAKQFQEEPIDSIAWENSLYRPTPTIIEAGISCYNTHNVEDIIRKDSVGQTFINTTKTIEDIIADAEKHHKKYIVFVTGTPGSGKSLIGMNIAGKYQDYENKKHAVYLTGNKPLVEVITTAITNDRAENSTKKLSKKEVRRSLQFLIQHLMHYRQEAIKPDSFPTEKIVVFDEAQRMWTQEQVMKKFKKDSISAEFAKPEPEVLIKYINKNPDWAVMICLMGGGQEINFGEEGGVEWLKVLKKYPNWHAYMSNQFREPEYVGESTVEGMLDKSQYTFVENLHLSANTRSYRAEHVSNFVNSLLERDTEQAKKYYREFKEKYPIVIARDLDTAKQWVRQQSKGTARVGSFTTSYGKRLAPEGILFQRAKDFNAPNWYLSGDENIDSSNFLELSATHFDSQGLEVDWGIVTWDAFLRPKGQDQWDILVFSRSKWKEVHDSYRRKYFVNAQRVILTRCRQGMVIFVPKGSVNDPTRKPEYYNGIYEYLKEIGLEDI